MECFELFRTFYFSTFCSSLPICLCFLRTANRNIQSELFIFNKINASAPKTPATHFYESKCLARRKTEDYLKNKIAQRPDRKTLIEVFYIPKRFLTWNSLSIIFLKTIMWAQALRTPKRISSGPSFRTNWTWKLVLDLAQSSLYKETSYLLMKA